MNNLLIDEYPLVVLPNLAKEIGLNEAIMLQQIHFWIKKRKNVREGISWVYNTYAGWVDQFPFWSESTIKRTIRSLEKQELLFTGNYNKLKIDNTKWYSIDYQSLKRVNRPSGQSEQMDGSKWTGASGQNEQAITIDYPEITTETNNYLEKIKELFPVFADIDGFIELNNEYWGVVSETRKTGKISDSVKYNNMKKWTKYDNEVVEHALKSHIKNHKGKREEYTLGIMRNTKKDEITKHNNAGSSSIKVARF